MNFLFPLYLAGALAVALPIYLHLRRRPPKDAVDFSSLMFLEPTQHQPLKRRSHLENIPLLILRCLALLFLAAMFSRPFFAGGDKEAGSGNVRTVVLLDVSASMQRQGLWEKASEQAQQAIDAVRSDGSLAVITIGETPRTLVSFDDWRNADAGRRAGIAKDAVKGVEPGWSGSDLGSGLIAAAEMVADVNGEDDVSLPAEIIVISDLQSGANLDAVAEATWPAELSVTLATVSVEDPTNATISASASTDPKKPMVRVRNDPDSATSEFVITAGDEKINAVVPPGESRVFQLESAAETVVLSGDAHAFDNRLYLAPQEATTVKLQFLGGGKPDDSDRPEYYFRRAFGFSEVLKPKFVDDLAEQPEILAIARSLNREEVAGVRKILENGNTVLMLMTDTNMAATLGELIGKNDLALREHEDGKYSLLEQIDFDHPALGEFRDPRWRDFTEVHFWRHREIDVGALPEGAKVIAKFDSGAPAWIDVPVGEGSLLVMMSGWHPRDSQLSLSTKFLPLLFSIFSDAGPKVGGVKQFFVGDALPETGDRPEKPGIFESFAVNLRPSESELTPLGSAPLVALGVPIDGASEAESASGSRELRGQESEAAQNLWRWAVVGLLALLLIESWLGARAEPSSNIPQPADS